MGYLFSVLQHANEILVIKVTMVVNRRALEHNIHLIHACQLTLVCVCDRARSVHMELTSSSVNRSPIVVMHSRRYSASIVPVLLSSNSENAFIITCSGSVPVSFSAMSVRKTVKLIAPGASLIIFSICSCVAGWPTVNFCSGYSGHSLSKR